MADEVSLVLVTPGTDADLHKQWKAQPPAFLEPDGYTLFDESYDTLVFRANVSTKTMKIPTWGWGKTLYTLSFTFRANREAAIASAIFWSIFLPNKPLGTLPPVGVAKR